MLRNFPPEVGYDFSAHWEYAEWLRRFGTMPRLEDHRLALHPPLFYLGVAWLIDHGGGSRAAQAAVLGLSLVRLGLVWLCLEQWLVGRAWARRIGLALAAVLPVSILMDGTVSGETVCATLVMGVIALVPAAFGTGRRSIVTGAVLGFVLGLGVLVKVSAVTLLGALGAGVLLQLVADGRDGWQGRARRLLPWIVGLIVFLGTAGWYFAWNRAIYGKSIVMLSDTPGLPYMPATNAVPVYFRRPPEFYFHWSRSIHEHPYFPSASLNEARFFPMLIASTFVDYYNHHFAAPRTSAREILANERPMPEPAMALGRGAMAAGTLIAAVTVVAWIVVSGRAWRTRDVAATALLLIPLLGLAAQIWYAQVFPHDWLAIVKGAYVLYAVPPLYAVFGVAVTWLARCSILLAAMPLGALVMVAVYSVWCRAV